MSATLILNIHFLIGPKYDSKMMHHDAQMSASRLNAVLGTMK